MNFIFGHKVKLTIVLPIFNTQYYLKSETIFLVLKEFFIFAQKQFCQCCKIFCKSVRKMFSDKNKIDETSGLSFIVICDNKIILFYEQKLVAIPNL